jgi:hypothetical protein
VFQGFDGFFIYNLSEQTKLVEKELMEEINELKRMIVLLLISFVLVRTYLILTLI